MPSIYSVLVNSTHVLDHLHSCALCVDVALAVQQVLRFDQFWEGHLNQTGQSACCFGVCLGFFNSQCVVYVFTIIVIVIIIVDVFAF